MAAEGSNGALLQETCAVLVETLEADACAISWLPGALILNVAQHTRSGERLSPGYGFLVPDYPLTREVVESCEPRTVSLLDDAPDPDEARVLRAIGFVSLLMLPLVVSGRCRALVEVYRAGDRRFAATDAEAGMRTVAVAAARLDEHERAEAVAS